MVETKKEKFIRFFFIVFFILIVLFALAYRQDKMGAGQTSQSLQALVLHASIAETDQPVAILCERKNNQTILGVYEIDKKDQYKFKTLNAKKFNSRIEKLSADQNENGFWALIDEEWHYFNTSLQEEKRNIKMMDESPYKMAFTYNKEEAKIMVNDIQSIMMDEEEAPLELHALSEGGQLWLILTDKGVKIAANDAK